jgi:hypothetical protein
MAYIPLIIRKSCRWVCMAVSFPVGVGSGLLPRPVLILPPEEGEYHIVESDKKADFSVAELFLLSWPE